MKFQVFAILMSIGINLFCQETGSTAEQKRIRFGFGYNLGLEALNKDVASKAGFSQYGFNFLDVYGNLSIFKYLSLNLGITGGQFKDESGLTQSVTALGNKIWSNIPFDEEYKIYTYGIYISGGGKIFLFSKLDFAANAGYRRFSAIRTIPDCKDCDNYNAGKDASFYIQPGLELFLWRDQEGSLALNLLYSHFFSSPFRNALAFGIFFGF